MCKDFEGTMPTALSEFSDNLMSEEELGILHFSAKVAYAEVFPLPEELPLSEDV